VAKIVKKWLGASLAHRAADLFFNSAKASDTGDNFDGRWRGANDMDVMKFTPHKARTWFAGILFGDANWVVG